MKQILQNARHSVKRNRAQCKTDAVTPWGMNEKHAERAARAARLREARESAGFKTARAACKRFGWKEGTYGTHESGHRGYAEMAPDYASAYKVNIEWLLTGRGQKATTAQGAKPVKGAYPKLRIDSQKVPLLVWGMINNANSVMDALKAPKSYVEVSTSKPFGPNAFQLVVEDESMLDPRFPLAGFAPGQELVFDPDENADPGDFVLAQVDGYSVELFRAYKRAGKTADGRERIALVPVNPSYEEIEFVNGVDGKILARLMCRVQTF